MLINRVYLKEQNQIENMSIYQIMLLWDISDLFTNVNKFRVSIFGLGPSLNDPFTTLVSGIILLARMLKHELIYISISEFDMNSYATLD